MDLRNRQQLVQQRRVVLGQPAPCHVVRRGRTRHHRLHQVRRTDLGDRQRQLPLEALGRLQHRVQQQPQPHVLDAAPLAGGAPALLGGVLQFRDPVPQPPRLGLRRAALGRRLRPDRLQLGGDLPGLRLRPAGVTLQRTQPSAQRLGLLADVLRLGPLALQVGPGRAPQLGQLGLQLLDQPGRLGDRALGTGPVSYTHL